MCNLLNILLSSILAFSLHHVHAKAPGFSPENGLVDHLVQRIKVLRIYLFYYNLL